MKLPLNLKSAMADYKLLLDKDYPPKSTLSLIGSRYKLLSRERTFLYRGVFSAEISGLRIRKRTDIVGIRNKNLYIDGLNQILTVISYLAGKPVFIASDGFLRDASEYHGKMSDIKLIDRAVLLVISYIQNVHPSGVHFFLDSKVNITEAVIRALEKHSTVPKYTYIIWTDKVDSNLFSRQEGVISTSDSQIIDRTNLSVHDLAAHTLLHHFNPVFLNLMESL